MDKQTLWKFSAETELIKLLKENISLQEIITRNKISDEAQSKKIIMCCDGRCPRNGDEISLAGSGILMDGKALEKFIKEIGDATITSHSDCGAAKLAFSMLTPEDAAEFVDADEFTKKWALSIAHQYGLGYKHIEATDFIEKIHHERGIILDSTLKFHPSIFRGMPNMFIANSPRFANDEYVQTVATVLTGIAFGDHGFGEFLTSEDPFYILIAGRDKEEETKLVDICSKAVLSYGDSVVVKSCCL